MGRGSMRIDFQDRDYTKIECDLIVHPVYDRITSYNVCYTKLLRIRGWANYFHLSETRGAFEELDGWLRRKLRCMLWRQWKRVWTRFKRLRARGLDEARAWKSATNGRGSWWNSGASHMHEAFPKKYFA